MIDLGRKMWIYQDRQFGLAEHIDESRRDNLAGGVDGALSWRGREIADGGDLAVANAEIA